MIGRDGEKWVDDGVRLGPGETAAVHEFTDPDRTRPDLRSVAVMLGEIRRRVASAASLPREPRPLVLESLEADGRAHRAVLCDERRLADGRDLVWVGFFAAKRRDRDHAPLTPGDDELVAGSSPLTPVS